MGFRVEVSAEDVGHVVTYHGVLDDLPVEAAVAGLAALARRGDLVVDLSHATLTSPAAVVALIDGVHALTGKAVPVVCGRLSGRRMLRRCCDPGIVEVLDDLPAPASDGAADAGAAPDGPGRAAAGAA
ncbi:MAG TPA: hypothetical protein VIL48_08710 [Acidimicrobiales bacterium]